MRFVALAGEYPSLKFRASRPLSPEESVPAEGVMHVLPDIGKEVYICHVTGIEIEFIVEMDVFETILQHDDWVDDHEFKREKTAA